MDEDMTARLDPCGHLGLCKPCATKILNSTLYGGACPWCRKPVISISSNPIIANFEFTDKGLMPQIKPIPVGMSSADVVALHT